MNYALRMLLAALLLTSASAGAQEVAGLRFPASVELAGEELTLNGAGLRTKFFIKVYAAALYLPRPADQTEAVLAMEGPKRLEIRALRDLSRDQLVDALRKGLADNLSESELEQLQPRIREFAELFTAADDGDVLLLEYVPGQGTRVGVNGALRGVIEGSDFHQALLRVWLGDKPAQDSLKRELLG